MEVLGHYGQRFDTWMDSVGHPWGNEHLPGAPWKVLAIISVYLAFVLVIGPWWMKNRKPYEIDGIMRIYNVVNVVLNVAIFLIAFISTNYSVKCWKCIDPYDKTDETPYWAVITGSFGYFYLKTFDLLDTVFFIIRKKNNQVTPLHVIHHASMPLTVYLGIKIAPMSPTIMIGILNTFVHIVMYSYYFLASYGPKMAPYLWWKKYLTLIQIVQFQITLIHSLVILLTPNCGYPKFISVLYFIEGGYFSYAFGSFYLRNYRKTNDVNANDLKKGK
ncbi:Elongation of very long chain fatty acids protein 4 [Halotydeus destructor]|nr:Elongation of very long chain fatty acids protein 4 [Halotydeus destructor]